MSDFGTTENCGHQSDVLFVNVSHFRRKSRYLDVLDLTSLTPGA